MVPVRLVAIELGRGVHLNEVEKTCLTPQEFEEYRSNCLWKYLIFNQKRRAGFSMNDRPRIFVSYSHADTKWLKAFDPHLRGLELHAKVERFDDRRLLGGDDWDAEVKAALDRADIILLLVTANFTGSAYIHRIELPTALKLRNENGSVVIPVLFEDCARQLLAIDDINYLPKDSGAC